MTKIKNNNGTVKVIKYLKYELNSPDYHYKRISKRIFHKFNAIVYARYQLEIGILKSLIKRKHDEIIKILDIGCGDSVFFYLLNKNIKEKNLKLYAIDNSELALKVAKEKNPNVIYKYADVCHLPFEDNYFDIIVSFDVIEHISYPNKMLSEIKRVGKNNASYIIGTPIRVSEQPRSTFHYQEFFPQEFHVLLGEYFNNIKIIQTQRLLFTLLYNHAFSLFKRKRYYFRYIINFFTIFFNKNLFFKSKNVGREIYSYMFGIGIIKK